MPYRRLVRLKKKGAQKGRISPYRVVELICMGWFNLRPGEVSRAVELTSAYKVVQFQRRGDVERTGRVEQSLGRVLEFFDGDG